MATTASDSVTSLRILRRPPHGHRSTPALDDGDADAGHVVVGHALFERPADRRTTGDLDERAQAA